MSAVMMLASSSGSFIYSAISFVLPPVKAGDRTPLLTDPSAWDVGSTVA